MAAGKPTSFRLSPNVVEMLERLEGHLNLTRSAVVALAVRRLYDNEFPGDKKPVREKKTGK